MAKLVRGVWVSGQHYGPDRQPDDDVARQITNPLAWEGGEVPFPAEDTDAGESSTGGEAAAEAEEQAKKAAPKRSTRARKKG